MNSWLPAVTSQNTRRLTSLDSSLISLSTCAGVIRPGRTRTGVCLSLRWDALPSPRITTSRRRQEPSLSYGCQSSSQETKKTAMRTSRSKRLRGGTQEALTERRMWRRKMEMEEFKFYWIQSLLIRWEIWFRPPPSMVEISQSRTSLMRSAKLSRAWLSITQQYACQAFRPPSNRVRWANRQTRFFWSRRNRRQIPTFYICYNTV